LNWDSTKPLKTGDIVFALSGGVLFSASQPPFITSFLAYFCLVPLLISLRDKSYRSAFLLGYLWGFISNLLSLYWIALPTFAGMLGAVFILSLYNALFGVIFVFIYRRNWIVALGLTPIIWTAIEYVRGYGQLGFSWMDIGYTQGPYNVLIQIADIVGHHGISFWIVCLNVLILAILWIKRRRWIPIILLIALVLAPMIYGYISLKQIPEGDRIDIALMQSNIGSEMKWEREFKRKNIPLYISMIDSMDEKVDLVVLPESATAYYHRNHPSIIYQLEDASAKSGAKILTGTLDYNPECRHSHYYNSAILVSAEGFDQTYNKIRLVPMSEHVPFQDQIPVLRKLELGGSHFAMGEEYTVFDFEKGDFSVAICFEILFGNLCRKFALNGATFICNITNDSWFGTTPGPYQHANFTRFRAVENRMFVARAAQTGISLFADCKGRIFRSLDLNTKGCLIGYVIPRTTTTFFTRHGQWMGFGSLIASPLLIMLVNFLFKV